MRGLVLLSLGLALIECRHKRDAIEERAFASVTPEPEKAPPPPDTPVPKPVKLGEAVQAVVRMRVTLNGRPLPEGVTCEATVYDHDSRVSKRGSGACDGNIAIAPGVVDVDARLSIMGPIDIHKRVNSVLVAGEPKDVSVDFTWAIGRLRVSHQETADVRGCLVSIQGTTLSGPDTTTFTLPVGTYDVDFDCVAVGPRVRTRVTGIVVGQGKDTNAVFRIQPGVAPSQTVQQVQVAPAPTEVAPLPVPIPGLPRLEPSPPPPQSSKPEDLTVQSYRGN